MTLIHAGPGNAQRSRGAPARHRWLTLAVVSIAQFMVVLDGTIVNVALPAVQRALGFTDGQRQWVVTAYALAFGSLLPLGGRIADLCGRKTTFLIGLVGFAGASALAGAAGDFTMLLAARGVQGAFGALLAPSALSLVTTTFTNTRERAKAFAVYGSLPGLGGATGLLLGGVLTEYLDWRWTLYINVAFAAVAFVGGALLIKPTARRHGGTLDIPGIASVSGGLFCLVYGVANAETHAWSSPRTWCFLVASAMLLLLFAWWQTRAEHPVLPLRILLDRDRGASFAALLIAAAGMFGVFLFLSYYLEQTTGHSAVATGLAFLPMIFGLTIGAMASARFVVPRVGPKPVVSTGMGLVAVGLVAMTGLGPHLHYVTGLLPSLAIVGLGLGAVTAPAQEAATLGVAEQDSGAASAAVNAMTQIGGSIGTALLTTIYTGAVAGYVAGPDPQTPMQVNATLVGYHTAFRWSAAFFAVGLIVTALLFRRGVPRRRDGESLTTDAEPVQAAARTMTREKRRISSSNAIGRSGRL